MTYTATLRALRSEWHKSRRTPIIWLAFGAPILYTFLIYLTFRSIGDKLLHTEEDVWRIIVNQSFNGLLLVFLPIGITLLVAWVHQLEHRANSWKQLYTLPLPRLSIFSAKVVWAFLLTGCSTLLYAILIMIMAATLSYNHPEWGIDNYSTAFIYQVLPVAVKGWGASVSIFAIQNWISYRSQSFIIPMIFGLAATLTTASIQRWEYIDYIPYAFPALTSNNNHLFYQLLSKSIISGCIIFLLSWLDAKKSRLPYI